MKGESKIIQKIRWIVIVPSTDQEALEPNDEELDLGLEEQEVGGGGEDGHLSSDDEDPTLSKASVGKLHTAENSK